MFHLNMDNLQQIFDLFKKRARWSEENLLRAIESVKKGMSLRKAAKEYNILQTTL